MKTIVATLFCSALLLGGLSRCATGDELDDLLVSGSPAESSQSDGASTSDARTDGVVNDSSAIETGSADGQSDRYHHSRSWEPTLGAASSDEMSDHARSVADDAKSSGPLSLVPEPSAVALAIAALVYFLIFGRRRNLV